jgi:hypothetical protein
MKSGCMTWQCKAAEKAVCKSSDVNVQIHALAVLKMV